MLVGGLWLWCVLGFRWFGWLGAMAFGLGGLAQWVGGVSETPAEQCRLVFGGRWEKFDGFFRAVSG